MKARSRFAIITTTLAALTISAAAYAADWKFPSTGTVSVKVLKHPKPSDVKALTSIAVEGSTPNVKISDDGSKITVLVKLDCDGKSCIKTGIDGRDEHLYEHINAKVHKTATLVIDKKNLKPAGGKTSGDVDGTLTLHGATHTVKVHYDVDKDGAVTATFKIKLGEYGIEPAVKMGICTGIEAAITANFKVTSG